MKKTRSADFCADRIDVITKFAVITNVVIKRVHCTYQHVNDQCVLVRNKNEYFQIFSHLIFYSGKCH